MSSLFLLTACVTNGSNSSQVDTQYAVGDGLMYFDIDKQFKTYLWNYTNRKDDNLHGVFAINQWNGRSSWSTRRNLGDAKKAAWRHCGQPCAIFMEDDKIVWQDLNDPEKYHKIQKQIVEGFEDVKSRQITYSKDLGVTLSASAKRSFESYLKYIENGSFGVFLVTADGEKTHKQYKPRKPYIRGYYEHLRKMLVLCDLLHETDSCSIYAVGDEMK